MDSLTAPERETVLTTSDEDDTLDIWTAQRPVITKLRKNPSAQLLEEGHHGKTVWARFSLPAELLSFRTAARRGQTGQTPAQKLASSKNLVRPAPSAQAELEATLSA